MLDKRLKAQTRTLILYAIVKTLIFFSNSNYKTKLDCECYATYILKYSEQLPRIRFVLHDTYVIVSAQ